MIDRRLLICGWMFLLAAAPAAADPFDYRGLTNQFAAPASREGRGVSLDDAVARARRQSDGTILSAETVRMDGRRVHRIKILTREGRVTRMEIDADTGRPATGRR